MITNIEQLDLSKRYTYADYLTWQFDDRVELIRGFTSKEIIPVGIFQDFEVNLEEIFE